MRKLWNSCKAHTNLCLFLVFHPSNPPRASLPPIVLHVRTYHLVPNFFVAQKFGENIGNHADVKFRDHTWPWWTYAHCKVLWEKFLWLYCATKIWSYTLLTTLAVLCKHPQPHLNVLLDMHTNYCSRLGLCGSSGLQINFIVQLVDLVLLCTCMRPADTRTSCSGLRLSPPMCSTK